MSKPGDEKASDGTATKSRKPQVRIAVVISVILLAVAAITALIKWCDDNNSAHQARSASPAASPRHPATSTTPRSTPASGTDHKSSKAKSIRAGAGEYGDGIPGGELPIPGSDAAAVEHEAVSRWGLTFIEDSRHSKYRNRIATSTIPASGGKIMVGLVFDTENRIHVFGCQAGWNDGGQAFLFTCLAMLPHGPDINATRAWVQSLVKTSLGSSDSHIISGYELQAHFYSDRTVGVDIAAGPDL